MANLLDFQANFMVKNSQKNLLQLCYTHFILPSNNFNFFRYATAL